MNIQINENKVERMKTEVSQKIGRRGTFLPEEERNGECVHRGV
jgi:hypothetical protein